MAFFVLMNREIRPDRLDAVLARIRERLRGPHSAQHGRRTSRVFQRLDAPTHLLTVSEWIDEYTFTEFRHSAVFAETDRIGGAPPLITPLVPLMRFEHMARRAAIASCVTVTATPENTPALRAYLVGPVHQEFKTLSGIVGREVYVARDTPGTFLVVHSWMSLADLEEFRATVALRMDLVHEQLRTTMTAFTGSLAAEFSVFTSPLREG
jgi:heme-degrading monooxygenase HmoA